MKRLICNPPLLISLFISLFTIALYYGQSPLFDMMESKSLDLRFRARGETQPGPEVAIVAIDEKSLDKLGRWPWPRKTIAQLIDALSEYNVNSIGFDIVFAEPDQISESNTLSKIEKKVKSLSIRNSELTSYLTNMKRDTDNDAILADAIRRSKRTILGYFFHKSNKNLEHVKAEDNTLPESMTKSAYSLIEYSTPSSAEVLYAIENYSIEANLPELSQGASDFGHFNINPDPDGSIRWAPLIMNFKGEDFPPLSLQLVRHYLGKPNLSRTIDIYGIKNITLGKKSIPTDVEGNFLINFRGGQKTFPHYSVYDVLEKKVPVEKLKNKIVLVGATAVAVYDMRVTPFDEQFPGVEVHANIIDNILHNNFLSQPDWTDLANILIILATGIFLGIVLPKLGARSAFIIFIVLLCAYIGGNFYAFVNRGYWLTIIYPLFSLLAIYITITLYRYMTEEREKKKVRVAFQYYMTSSVVNEVLKNPEKLKLGGDKKVLTVLFSDIRSFTTISEKMEPQALVHFLNEYLTVMTDRVFEHDGVLDKYMGDAIMAIYGAPMERLNHPYTACLTALDMMQDLKKLHKTWEEKNFPRIDIGIGVATGPMVVGNMGSERRFDYTVMGDTVNLGSRLEGLNKVYGSNIIISEETYREVKDKLVCRQLDAVKVKGKNRPVKIFELLAKEDGDKRYLKLAESFESALGLYTARKWMEAIEAFEGVLKIRPNDPPAQLYIKRCKALYQSPPPADWNGLFILKTK